MNALAQFKIVERWALGLGWFMMGRFLQAGAVELRIDADSEVQAFTRVKALQPWIEFAAIADPIQC